jgi:hypothetical protein
MTLAELWQQVGVSTLGGVAAEVLHWYMLSRRARGIAGFRKHGGYWVLTCLMVALGGIMPVIYISGAASAALCFHLGAATPVLLQKLVVAAPRLTPMLGSPTDAADWRDFFRW